MAFARYVQYYNRTWADPIKRQDGSPLEEYKYRPMLTTWTMSYEQVRKESKGAADLLKL